MQPTKGQLNLINKLIKKGGQPFTGTTFIEADQHIQQHYDKSKCNADYYSDIHYDTEEGD